MKTTMKMMLAGVVFAMLASTSALAYKPTGWAYNNYPYLYESTNREWAYFRTTDSPQVVNLTSRWTGSFKNSVMANATWNYWTQYPYVYCSRNRNWYFFYRTSSQWVRNMVTGQWSLLGTTVARTGEIQFKLTWDKAVDLDLSVTVRGETISYLNKIGSAGAIGGVLDVDDRDGYGPENIYWAVGRAPQPPTGQYIMFQPKITYFSGSVDVNYTLEYRATGSRNVVTTWPNRGLPYIHRGTFRANERGLSDIPPSMHYYGR